METRMNLCKMIFTMLFAGFFAMNVFAENVNIVVELTRVNINGGNVHVFVFSNENDYKKELPFTSFILESINNRLTYELNLPEGEYLISAYQDVNNNGKLDTGFFGIPKEPVGMTNYDGRGAPGGFNKLKVPVNRSTTAISVNLGMIKL